MTFCAYAGHIIRGMIPVSLSRPLRVPAALILLGALQWGLAAKRPVSHADYDGWRNIATATLSRDGGWLAYGDHPQDGDGEIVIRNLSSGAESRHPVGALPPPPLPDPTRETPPEPRGISISFTSDGKWLITTTYPEKAATEAAKKAKKKPDELPKTGMLIVNLVTGKAERIPDVKSVRVPAKGGAWAAWLAAPAAGAKKEEGTELALRDLATGAERKFPSVTEYGLARDGALLWFTVSAPAKDAAAQNGVFVLKPGDAGAPAALASGKGKFNKVAWDREQKRMAFLMTPAEKGAKSKVFLHERGSASASALAGVVASDKGSLTFSRDGARLFIPAPGPHVPSQADPDEKKEDVSSTERVLLDIWNYRDDVVQPMQKIRATQDRNFTYRGVWHIADSRYVQLADEAMRTIAPDDSGLRAFGSDDRAYRRMVDYDGGYADIYVVDTKTGQRRKALEKMRAGGPGGSPVSWSPDGKWGLFFRDRNWHILDAGTLEVKHVTASLGVPFQNEDDDTPAEPGGYGTAGWLRDSASAIVYDKFDVWRIFPNGQAAVNLTRGEGRKTQVQYRVMRIEPEDEDDPDARYLDPGKPLHLRGESLETRETGFFASSFAAASAPKRLLWGAKDYNFVARAREADVVIVRAERFDEYPDLHVTDPSFRKLAKVSNGGAQMEPFLWGTSELIRFRNADGVALQAALFKPAGFDPKKKYPLMVYIYERLSQSVHGFVAPAPGTSVNTTYYTSNGYVVLRPDIVYAIGRPGQSALKCVLPAIQEVVDMGFIDEDNIGIQGHSWGGYQIAYMVTQTKRFKAAEAGAPVGNMTSAYSGIRWGSGMPRQFQYEKTQSRIGEPLVDAPLKYFENSPVFFADRVTTPLLILHNDQDDAVPWYQGIELFLALRRQGKEAYLLNYNGEYHGLRRRWNQKDYTVRMQQFFDHHLKGAPSPEWMKEGVPYLEREREKFRFQGAVQ